MYVLSYFRVHAVDPANLPDYPANFTGYRIVLYRTLVSSDSGVPAPAYPYNWQGINV